MKLIDLIPKVLLKSEHDAISLLEADHDKVLELFEHFEDIKDSNAHKEKQTVVADACRELTVHAMVEEEIFYPAVGAAIEAIDLMNEALVEHSGAKSLIHDLEQLDAGDEMFNAKFTVLSEYVRHHIKEERDYMFPLVRATVIDLEALGQKIAARKDKLMTSNGSAEPQPRPTKRKQRSGKGESRRPR